MTPDSLLFVVLPSQLRGSGPHGTYIGNFGARPRKNLRGQRTEELDRKWEPKPFLRVSTSNNDTRHVSEQRVRRPLCVRVPSSSFSSLFA